jgi:hypothetical protein
MSFGANNVVETPPVLIKKPMADLKKACKTMKQDEDDQNHKKSPRRSWARNQMGNPSLKEFYLRLRAAGKKPLVAMTACMRKLIILMNRLLKNYDFQLAS